MSYIASFVYGATVWIDMPLLIYDTLDVCEESFLYFYNVLGENQYFPFEAPPKSGF